MRVKRLARRLAAREDTDAGKRTVEHISLREIRDSPSARYGGKFVLTGETRHLLRKTTNVATVLRYPLPA